jgi:hypothetical protein
MHKYNNQDYSMMTAIYAARNILGARYDLWAVNTELQYHEEKAERRSLSTRIPPRHADGLAWIRSFLPRYFGSDPRLNAGRGGG